MSINKYIALVTALLVNLSSGYLWAGAGDTENIKKATALLNKLDFANISSYPYLSHP